MSVILYVSVRLKLHSESLNIFIFIFLFSWLPETRGDIWAHC